MKKYWLLASTRIDGLSLRERAILFATTAGLIVFMVFFFYLNPLYAKQKLMLADMARNQDQIAGVDAEILLLINAHTKDPDAADRARLEAINSQAAALSNSLMATQQGMVTPERVIPLLGEILRAHDGLKLKSLRTLGEAAAPAATAPGVARAAAPATLIHQHGVELIVQGSYPDMVAYMKSLETMRGQIFWAHAAMRVDEYPQATLTLKVYTINLDKKWLKL
jgi:MSHA biogenesis protein MshJ